MTKPLVVVDGIKQERFPEGLFEPHERGSVSTFTSSCGRFVNLQTQERETEDPGPTPGYFLRGNIFHSLCEYGYGRPDIEVAIQLPSECEEDKQTAMRLYGALRQVLPQDFANRIETEVPMPCTPEEKETILEMMGVPFKGIIDAVVEFDEEKAAAFDAQWFGGVDKIVEGVYLWDWKTEGSTEREHKYTMGHQGISYLYVYELLTGVRPKGMIFCRVVDNKVPKVIMTYRPPPTLLEIPMMIQDFQRTHEAIVSNRTNGFACFTRYSICKFYTNGKCARV